MKGVGVCGEKKAATNLKMLNVKKSRVHKKASASTPPHHHPYPNLSPLDVVIAPNS